MNLRHIWQRIATSRRTREREAAAQYERVHREGALRDDFARRAHAFESQIAPLRAEIDRLRAENRALLNSVLGIAGIPPVIVADSPSATGTPAAAGMPELYFVGARHVVPGADAWRDAAPSGALSSRQRRDVCADEGSAVRVDGEEQKQIPRTTPCLPEIRGTSSNAQDSARDYNAIDGSVAANSAASPSMVTGRSSAAPLQKQLRRASAQKDPRVIAPIRRRSWHQIYRMLEFESSRRKEREP